jgi:hypothetical protein
LLLNFAGGLANDVNISYDRVLIPALLLESLKGIDGAHIRSPSLWLPKCVQDNLQCAPGASYRLGLLQNPLTNFGRQKPRRQHRDMHGRAIVGRVTDPRVYGSVLTGKDDDESDLDLLVDATEKTTLFTLVGLEQDAVAAHKLPQLVTVRGKGLGRSHAFRFGIREGRRQTVKTGVVYRRLSSAFARFANITVCETRSLTLVAPRHYLHNCAQLSSWASPMRSPSGPRM